MSRFEIQLGPSKTSRFGTDVEDIARMFLQTPSTFIPAISAAMQAECQALLVPLGEALTKQNAHGSSVEICSGGVRLRIASLTKRA